MTLQLDVVVFYEAPSQNLVLDLDARMTGCLTGSRVAGSLGRALVIDVVSKVSCEYRCVPLCVAKTPMFFATWVDNIYCLGPTGRAAVVSMLRFQEELARSWRLEFKDGSRSWLSADPDEEGQSAIADFVYEDPFVVLGHQIQSSGAHACPLEKGLRAAWRRVWAGPAARIAKKVPLAFKLKDMDRCAWPSLAFRSTAWSITATTLNRVAAEQRAMVAAVLRVPRLDEEDDATYVKRRAKLAAGHCDAMGAWDVRIARRTLEWHAHLLRGSSPWASELVVVANELWLQSQRRVVKSASVHAGRLGTRTVRGQPAQRWHQAVERQSRVPRASEHTQGGWDT